MLCFVKHSPLGLIHFVSIMAIVEVANGKIYHTIYKRVQTKQVQDQLSRIAKVDMPEISPIIGSEATRNYRNKLDFAFSSKRWATREEIDQGGEIDMSGALGFHVSGAFDKILDIKECHLQASPSNEIRTFIREYTKEHGYEYYDVRSHEGYMRNIVIRTASTGDVMVIVIFNYEDKERREALLDAMITKFDSITSLIYIINEKWNDSYSDQETICYFGNDHIMESMEGLKFKVGQNLSIKPTLHMLMSFYKATREAAELKESDVVYDQEQELSQTLLHVDVKKW